MTDKAYTNQGDCGCDECTCTKLAPQDQIEILKQAFAAKSHPTPLAVGQIVMWRNGLRYAHFPEYGHPAIVMGFVVPELNSDKGSTLEEDVLLGVIDLAGVFRVFPFEGWRFQPYGRTASTLLRPKTGKTSPLN